MEVDRELPTTPTRFAEALTREMSFPFFLREHWRLKRGFS